MKRATVILMMAPTMLVAQRYEREWRVKDDETIRRSFDVSASSSPQRLLVDNVNGSVHVTGYNGKEIQVVVQKHIGADSNEAMQEAKRDVKLDLSQQGNYVRLYVDGPFRVNDGVSYRGDDYYGYRVILDYEIQVPFATELVLKNVSHGEIQVKKTTGPFTIRGVNGGIEMEDVSGYGSVRTVNGPLKASFTKNPEKECEFRTLNGKMDIYFQPGLNADLFFSTLNGGIYTDFDITTVPARPVAGENVNGKFVYRRDGRSTQARTGKGGPELSFHTLNGAIRIHSKIL